MLIMMNGDNKMNMKCDNVGIIRIILDLHGVIVDLRKVVLFDGTSLIFKHLQNSEHCSTLCSLDCFHILYHASTSFQLKIRGFSYSKRTTFLESTITPCESKIILLFPHCHISCSFCCHHST